MKLTVKKLKMFMFLFFISMACESAEVASVKNGILDGCPDRTIGEMVSCYMGSPKWESIVAEDGNSYVNISGSVMLNDKEVNALLQFMLHDDDRFEVNAFEMNEIPQNMLMFAGLMNNMCECED